MNKNLGVVAFIAAAVLVAGPAHATTVIYTQSFETSDGALNANNYNGYFYSSASAAGNFSTNNPMQGVNFSAVTFTNSSGIQANGSAWNFAGAPAGGSQTAFIQSNGGAAGQISLGLPSLTLGDQYRVTFDLAQRAGYGIDPITVTIDGKTETFSALTSTSSVTTSWTPYTFTFTADGSMNPSLVFSGLTQSGDTSVGLDAVSVAAVPEPTTWFMMLLGFGMIGFAMRKRSITRTTISFA